MAALKGARVMLVEDNDMNQELALELLANAGIDVTLAVNGKEAVEKIAADSAYDGVLMDCQMPVMDGYTATREIRKNPALKDLPIIAMTANAMAGDREKVIDAGMNDHIAKPLNVAAMFTTMAKWIKPKSATPKTPPDAPNSGAASAMNTRASGGNSTKADAVTEKPPGQYSEFQDELDRLEALLRDSDAEATDYLEEVQEKAAGTALGFGLKRVANALDSFDFDGALKLLFELRG
jgi:CheY-like chemotaxis protein